MSFPIEALLLMGLASGAAGHAAVRYWVRQPRRDAEEVDEVVRQLGLTALRRGRGAEGRWQAIDGGRNLQLEVQGAGVAPRAADIGQGRSRYNLHFSVEARLPEDLRVVTGARPPATRDQEPDTDDYARYLIHRQTGLWGARLAPAAHAGRDLLLSQSKESGSLALPQLDWQVVGRRLSVEARLGRDFGPRLLQVLQTLRAIAKILSHHEAEVLRRLRTAVRGGWQREPQAVAYLLLRRATPVTEVRALAERTLRNANGPSHVTFFASLDLGKEGLEPLAEVARSEQAPIDLRLEAYAARAARLDGPERDQWIREAIGYEDSPIGDLGFDLARERGGLLVGDIRVLSQKGYGRRAVLAALKFSNDEESAGTLLEKLAGGRERPSSIRRGALALLSRTAGPGSRATLTLANAIRHEEDAPPELLREAEALYERLASVVDVSGLEAGTLSIAVDDRSGALSPAGVAGPGALSHRK